MLFAKGLSKLIASFARYERSLLSVEAICPRVWGVDGILGWHHERGAGAGREYRKGNRADDASVQSVTG